MNVDSQEVTVKEAVAVIELVTNEPELVREALRVAVDMGLIERKSGRIIIKRGQPLHDLEWPKPKVTSVAGADNCKRCGRRISICNYITLEGATLGPFGSDCLKRLKLAYS